MSSSKVAYYSNLHANVCGTSIWATPDGREVEVTCVERKQIEQKNRKILYDYDEYIKIK